jgi:excisionase family DNA binding protein
MMNSELLTPTEAARLARCSVRTLRRAYWSGRLPAYRSLGGRNVRLLREEVIAFFLAEPASELSSPRPRTRPSGGKRSSGASRGDQDPLSIEAIRSRRS